jgi:hypothetical protein
MALHAICLFCEDLREEKSGQITLVGILPDNVNLPPTPEVKEGLVARPFIPKLALYVRMHIGIEDDPGTMTLKVVFPNGEETALGDIENDLIVQAKRQATEKGMPIAGLLSYAVLSGFQAVTAGVVSVVLETKDQRSVIGIMNLIQDTESKT